MKRIALWIGGGLGAVVLLIVAYVGVVFLQASGGLPRWEGTFEVAGPERAVRIVRDENGVAHVFAETERDLIFAQGFVHAQDRFWQMDLMRKRSAGRLSEWFGASALRQDRTARASGFSQAAERLWAQFPAEEKPLLEAYAAGVNAWLNSPAYRRPPEMVLLHVKPEPWRPQDSFLVWRQVYIGLVSSGRENFGARVRQAAKSPEASRIWSSQDTEAPTILPSSAGRQPTSPVKDRAYSNSWVLSGRHTASGRPLLANDPQLPATSPNFWHLQHLSSPGRTSVGATVPGVPGLVVGRTGRLAWGATNALIDVNDVALIEVDPTDPARYRAGPGQPWREFERRRERFVVRFGGVREETFERTEHGFVVPDDLLSLPFEDAPNLRPEFHLHGLEFETTPAATLRITRAESVEEGLSAVEAMTGPAMNLSFADADGRIAYVTSGVIPSRPERHARTVGLAPDDGNARTYLPYAQNPRIVNPPSGRIVTANQQIVGADYPHYLTDWWAPAERARRIHEALDERPVHDPESFRRMQQDNLSPIARTLTPYLLGARAADPKDGALVEALRGWDHRFDPGSTAPTVFMTWVEMLSRRLFADELEGLPPQFRSQLYLAVEFALRGEEAVWCDDVRTPAKETCDAALTASLTDARAALEKAYGADPARWTWGRAHRLHIAHLGFGGVPLLDGLFSRRVVSGAALGGLFTAQLETAAAPRFARSVYNSSFQAIYDLSDLDASLFGMAGGQSGHWRSPFYDNLTDRWVRGERFRIETDPKSIEAEAELTLRPKTDAAARR